jgi:hypothetical protein
MTSIIYGNTMKLDNATVVITGAAEVLADKLRQQVKPGLSAQPGASLQAGDRR